MGTSTAVAVEGWAMRARGAPLEPFTYEAVPGPGQALVEVAACGVCHTDLSFLDDGVPVRHPLPLVLGHEVSGRVVALGDGAAPGLLGRSVVVPAVIPCGGCGACFKGRGSTCQRQVFPGNDGHGGFATHLLVPAHGLCRVDLPFESDDLRRLAVVADAVSTAFEAVRRSDLSPGDLAVFVGAGGVGGFGVQVARALGARALAIDVDPRRLELMTEHGAEWTLDARGLSAAEVKARARALAKQAGLSPAGWRVFETSGTRAGQEAAFALLGPAAHLAVVGYHAGDVTVRLSNLMAFDARAEGVWGCPPARYPQVLDLVLSGRVKVAPFVELFPLAQVNQVLDRLRRKDLDRRPVLVPAGASA
ncbi:MAG: 6-hydroxycyclohex-1-ene-1-carbonyl-CoA dehydrogenase [Planctomycetes bacterium]|nr:6-hydroxycyclohex-1-ene-1-carbonyl-CoA dehydrogenase [Planctomycetota bacterium]